jgi:hypothetical protein
VTEIHVTTFAAPIELIVQSSEPATGIIVSATEAAAEISVVSGLPGLPGGVGPPGPDPWMEPVQHIDAAGDTQINYAAGKYVKLHVTADCSLSVINWPVANRIARLTLEILNDGFSILAWPAGTIWQNGSLPTPTATPGARDRIILSTTDGGLTIYGDPIGYDYR